MTDEEIAVRAAAVALGLTKTWTVKLSFMTTCYVEAVDEQSAIAVAKTMFTKYEQIGPVSVEEYKNAKR